MVRLCVLFLLISSVYTSRIELDEEWEDFKERYNKQYTRQEEIDRRAIWENNVDVITRHNLQADMGLHTYTLGQNKYADMSHEDFKAAMTGFLHSYDQSETYIFNITATDLPTSVDWRAQGYVTRVKDQGNCGSCWAFAATTSLEGQHFKKTGTLVSLSDQNLVDCSRSGNSGCNGGHFNTAYRYIASNEGIDTEESYPYVAKQEDCKFRPEFVGATATGYHSVAQSETALKSAVGLKGPISIGMDASPRTFHLYKSGVYSDSSCRSFYLNHAVAVVGYGSQDGKDYWLVKNSWGTTWGEDGYVKMARNANNMCGVATVASYPTV